MSQAMGGLVAAMLGVLVLGAVEFGRGAEPERRVYSLVPDANGVTLKTPDGRTVFGYMTKKPEPTNLTANSVCCLYPVFTPSGVRAVDFAPGDHRHHRGVFLAWHSMVCGPDRADFWGWGELAPTENRVIRNRDVQLTAATADHAVLTVHNDWCIAGKTVVGETLGIRVAEVSDAFVIDLDFALAPTVDLQLERSAFGGLCVKGRKEGKASYTSPEGTVKLADPHHLKPETDWPSAAWYDYTVQLDAGQTVGVTIVDHPRNPPSSWHNLGPIAMLNPCIVAPGSVQVAKGDTLELRYRLIVHDGPPSGELLAARADEFRK